MAQAPLVIPKTITLNWAGSEPLAIPKAKSTDKQQFLQPGENTIPMASWHRMGAVVDNTEHIAAGRLSVVHKAHQFVDHDDHCLGCSMTKQDAEAERVAKAPVKGKAQAAPRAP